MGKKVKMTAAEMRSRKYEGYFSLIKLHEEDAFYKPTVQFSPDCVFKTNSLEDQLMKGTVTYKEQTLTAESSVSFYFHPKTLIRLLPNYENDNSTNQSGSEDNRSDLEQEVG